MTAVGIEKEIAVPNPCAGTTQVWYEDYSTVMTILGSILEVSRFVFCLEN